MTISTASRTTIVPIDRAYDDADELLQLVQASGPYWNQSRYIPNGAKLGPGHPLAEPDGPPGFPATPVFRADWFRRTDSTPEGRRLASHEPFLAAARVVHAGTHVVPLLVHVNNQTAHLNYTNRVANGLGLLHEIDAETYNPFAAIPS